MAKMGAPIGTGMSESKTALGKFLRERRIALGLTQEEAAKLIGIGQSHYSTCERGIFVCVSKMRFPDFARVLKCDIAKLDELAPKKKAPQTQIGKLIRSLREKSKLSICELAKILNQRSKNVYALEIRRSPKMRFETATRLAQALNLEASTFNKFVGLARLEAKGKLGKLVRSRRNSLHLTQEQLARTIRKTKAYVSLIESGKVNLKFGNKTRHLLAVALGLDPAALDNAVSRKEKRGKTKSEAPQFQI